MVDIPSDLELAARLLLALVLGAVVGFEREVNDQPAGLRTHIAVSLGACLVEKHFTLDRAGGGPDDSFSLEPRELEALCRDARTAWEALGRIDYSRQQSESGNAQFRRSLYVVRDIAAGERVDATMVRSIRPGFGAAPRHLDALLGRRARHALKRGTPVALEDFE